MEQEIVELEMGGIFSLIENSTLEGFGCGPDRAYVDLRDSAGKRHRLTMTPTLKDGKRDWSFGVEDAPPPFTWDEDVFFAR